MSELLEKILDKGNMNEAYKKVCANRGAGGVDGMYGGVRGERKSPLLDSEGTHSDRIVPKQQCFVETCF